MGKVFQFASDCSEEQEGYCSTGTGTTGRQGTTVPAQAQLAGRALQYRHRHNWQAGHCSTGTGTTAETLNGAQLNGGKIKIDRPVMELRGG